MSTVWPCGEMDADRREVWSLGRAKGSRREGGCVGSRLWGMGRGEVCWGDTGRGDRGGRDSGDLVCEAGESGDKVVLGEEMSLDLACFCFSAFSPGPTSPSPFSLASPSPLGCVRSRRGDGFVFRGGLSNLDANDVIRTCRISSSSNPNPYTAASNLSSLRRVLARCFRRFSRCSSPPPSSPPSTLASTGVSESTSCCVPVSTS
mmetsp:Transcript_31264/g.73390  ORF Transcript_31264/g.73390 Transcript_31264/m.73390 type:complete len:204 (-) Transcript_31264:789-1400(-)